MCTGTEAHPAGINLLEKPCCPRLCGNLVKMLANKYSDNLHLNNNNLTSNRHIVTITGTSLIQLCELSLGCFLAKGRDPGWVCLWLGVVGSVTLSYPFLLAGCCSVSL